MNIDFNTKERKKIGIELHEEMGHDLLAIAMKIGMLADNLEKKSIPETKDAQNIEREIINVIKKNRVLANWVFPTNLENVSISDLVLEFKKELEKDHKIECFIDVDESININKIEIITNLYFIIQEAVNYIIWHSGAQKIWIELYNADGLIHLTIRDDGRGIVKRSTNKDCVSTRSMQYRAGLINAVIVIKDRIEGGVEIICKFSIDN